MNPKYNLQVQINNETVLRVEDTTLNRFQVKQLFKGEKYKLVKV